MPPGDPEFIPRQHALTALRRWWWIALAALLGGLAGWGMHSLRPTVYEARFEVLLNLDQVASGELERFEEDTALDAAGAILNGAPVLERVAAQAVAEGLPVTPADLAAMSSVERRRATWMVRLRDRDPARAARLVELWLETGYAALLEAHGHAVQAESLQRRLSGLESCLQRAAAARPAETLCGRDDLPAVQAEIQSLGAALAQERRLARGLTGFVLVGSAEKAAISPQAVANQRGALILAGALIGLVIGVWAGQLSPRPRQER